MFQHDLDEIQRLKQQLEEKDRIIADLQRKDDKSYVRNLLGKEIDSLHESVAFSDIQSSNAINDILNEPNLEIQIKSLFSFIKKKMNAIPRLCAQLRGHVDFLTRLASTPELQTLFLISDHSGNIFLPETARQLLLEQAARTSQLISEYPQLTKNQYGNDYTTINDAFQFDSISCNPNKRLSCIKKLLSDETEDQNELASLFIQEVMISSSLQNIASKANDSIHQIHDCLSSVLQSDEMNNRQTKHHQTNKKYMNEFDEDDENTLTNFNQNGEFQTNYHDTVQLAKKVAQMASWTGQEPNLYGSNINTKETFNQYKYEKYSAPKESKISYNKYEQSDWVRWARRLYHGLTKLPSENVDDTNLRIAIEEAALTSIGTQVLQNRLNSLRIQKSVMVQPHIENRNTENSFKVPLICVTFCLRMISDAYNSNEYSTKRKASLWSKKNVLNK